jgi:hypothetical protein
MVQSISAMQPMYPCCGRATVFCIKCKSASSGTCENDVVQCCSGRFQSKKMFDSVQQTSWTIKIRIHWLILSLSPIWGPFEAHLRLVWVSIEVVAGCSSVFVRKFDFELILREFTGITENHWKQQKITSRPVWVSLRKFYVSPNSSSRSFRVRFEMFPGQK